MFLELRFSKNICITFFGKCFIPNIFLTFAEKCLTNVYCKMFVINIKKSFYSIGPNRYLYLAYKNFNLIFLGKSHIWRQMTDSQTARQTARQT